MFRHIMDHAVKTIRLPKVRGDPACYLHASHYHELALETSTPHAILDSGGVQLLVNSVGDELHNSKSVTIGPKILRRK